MKKRFNIHLISLLFVLLFSYANYRVFAIKADTSPDSPIKKEMVNEWIAASPVHFIENKGQMTDLNHIPVPFVLFKASSPGIDAYITEKGLTYVFIKSEKEEKEEGERSGTETGYKEEDRKTEISWINLHLSGASIKRENIIREGESQHHFNYFYAHCPDGIYGVKEYEKITIREVYPGIDWVLYGSSKKGMKYDFVVHPGSNPAAIKLIYEGEKPLELDNKGNLHIKTPLGELTENAPYSYIYETKKAISSRFTKKTIDDHQTEVSFSFPSEESWEGATLIIDPQLVWATFYGGNVNETPSGIDTDSNGNVYVTGTTWSLNFPFQTWQLGTTYNQILFGGGLTDIFLLRFTNSGNLTWATYYGGGLSDNALYVAIDEEDNVYLTGNTSSPNFPTQSWPGAYNDSIGGGNSINVFILRFTNAGIRTWATYYGHDISGTNTSSTGHSIALDKLANIYITGTTSSNFPTKIWPGAYNQTIHGGGLFDAFILRFSNTGKLTWATYYGGSLQDFGNSIACDGTDNIYVTGATISPNFPIQSSGGAYNDSTKNGNSNRDAFILRFSSAGIRTWATYYGGSIDDEGYSIACDRADNVYVTGITGSSNFPTKTWMGAYNDSIKINNEFDAFILRFTKAGILSWGTYCGGNGGERNNFVYDNLAIDKCGNIYISFETNSSDLFTFQTLTCGHYLDQILNQIWNYSTPDGNSNGDNFLIKFSNSGSILWATYFGGSQHDQTAAALSIDNNGNLFIAGQWMNETYLPGAGTGYPLTNPGGGAYYDSTSNGGADGFIAKFQSTPITISQSQVNTSSGCLCDGSATLHADLTCGGSPVYLWNTGAATNSITDLCPGSYSVIFSNSCSLQRDTLYFTISGPPPVTVTTSSTVATCGNNDGTATVNPSGGTLPYTYSWSPNTGGQISQTASNLEAGIYTCTVTDAMNCSVTVTVTVSNSGGATVIIDSITNVSCYGGNDGAVYITATGDDGPFTYSWSNDSITKDITALTTGTYYLTVTDANECKTLIDTTIAEPSLLSARVISDTPVSCNGAGDGAIDITVTGGTGNYSYSWSNGANTEDINPLPAGVYDLTVTDDNGCIATAAATISEPEILTTALDTIINVACNGENSGAIYITVTGGTSPYAYSWSNGALTEDIAELETGNYSVIITDPKGCRDSIEAPITEPPALTVIIDNVTHLTCGGDSNGTIDITVAGGIIPYSYSWSNGDTTGNIKDLIAGNYSLLLTDANGCTLITDTTITEPPPIIISFTNLNHVSCYGASNGSATADVTGGAAPYSYTWDPPVSSTAAAFNLAPGNYTVLIKDDSDCEQTASFTINEPDSLVAAVSGPASICEGESAIIHAIVTGGTAPYTYAWSPGAMNDSSVTVSPSVTTTYTVAVTDANGCTAVPAAIAIAVNALPIISFTTDLQSGCAPLCVSFNNTTLNTSTVNWNFGDGNSGVEAAITHCYPDPGTYDVTLTVTDNNGCTNSLLAPDLIKVFPNPVANFTLTPPYAAPIFSTVFFNNQSSGALNWLWDFGDRSHTTSTAKNPAFNYKETGAYTVSLIVKSDEGCSDTISHAIIIEPEFSLYIPNAFTPDGDEINDFFSPKGVEFSSFEMEIYNRWGEKIYHTSDIDKPWNGRAKVENEISKQDVYVYKIRVKDFKDETHYYVGNVTLIR